ncbi:hypothetical protein C3L33_07124, partial [Rhododendron williamsianum]
MSTNPAPESNPASTSSSPSEAPKPPIEPLRLPTPDEIRGQDIWNNCAVRSVFSGVVGGGLGLALGLFLGSFDTPIMQDTMTGKQQFIYQAKQMGRKSWSNCKTFAVMGLIFSAAECVVEKARAKHDTTNTAVAGCVTGGALSAPDDEKETKHLESLEGAESRLRLFQIDLLDYDSIVAAVNGAAGVLHLASPCIVEEVKDPENELLAPAIKGTNNVLTAAKEVGVRRVVVTSSTSAITPSPYWPADKAKNEDCWTDVDYCKQNGEKGLDVVVVNPGTVMGPILPPTLNASMLMLLRLLQEALGNKSPWSTETYENIFMGSIHVKDVALAHILVYENTSATGRHLCVEAISHYGDFAAMVAELYPEYNIPRLPKDTQPGLLRSKNASTKLMDLGLQFIPKEQIIKESVESLKSKGFIS